LTEARILVVDDDPQIRRVMRASLAAQRYEVDEARSGEEALQCVHSGRPDLILLDINLPGITGLEACRKIRLSSEVPIIVMTVRDTEKDKVEALDAGADDYVAKPFGMPEMLARIRATLRRTPLQSEPAATHLRLGEVEIDFEARRIKTPTAQLRLTSKEFELLSYFAAHPNRPIPHRELLSAVWGPDYGEEHEYLRVFVNRLRKKIEPSPKAPKYLLKEPWVGYRLELPKD
jgi:two-component system, OmpR family, KDP operon response regulator KdpE